MIQMEYHLPPDQASSTLEESKLINKLDYNKFKPPY